MVHLGLLLHAWITNELNKKELSGNLGAYVLTDCDRDRQPHMSQ